MEERESKQHDLDLPAHRHCVSQTVETKPARLETTPWLDGRPAKAARYQSGQPGTVRAMRLLPRFYPRAHDKLHGANCSEAVQEEGVQTGTEHLPCTSRVDVSSSIFRGQRHRPSMSCCYSATIGLLMHGLGAGGGSRQHLYWAVPCSRARGMLEAAWRQREMSDGGGYS